MKFTRAAMQKLGFEGQLASSIEIKAAVVDSRQVKKDYAFIAIDGESFLGKDFIEEALKKKASCVLVDKKYQAEIEQAEYFEKTAPVYFAREFQSAIAAFASSFYESPSESLNCVAVTGTNGKTTIAMALFEIARQLKDKAIYIGTLGAKIGSETIETGFTTPGVIKTNELLQRAIKKKADHAFIEASSHGLHQGRLADLSFKIGIFTNLTQDHLDYHGSLEEYFKAKQILFDQMLKQAGSKKRPLAAIINIDDDHGLRLYEYLIQKKPAFHVISMGYQSAADLRIENINADWSGYSARLRYDNQEYKIETRFLGIFNIYNLSITFLTSILLGFKAEVILKAIKKIKPAAGRMERIEGPEGRNIIIDYAHTPDALENALKAVNELNPIRTVCIFGCGGDRDKGKREIMGRVASTHADFCIITNDNPRSEDPQSIANQVKKGMENSNYIVVFDRDKAIKVGLQILGMQEALLIAGKGHEEYQVIGGETFDFSDRKHVVSALKKVNYAPGKP